MKNRLTYKEPNGDFGVVGLLTADDVFNRISEHYAAHPTEKGGGE